MFIFYPVTLLNSPISFGPYLPPSPLSGPPGLATFNYLLKQEQKNITGEKKICICIGWLVALKFGATDFK